MLIGYGGAFLGGMAAILSPCAVLLLPAFFAYAFNTPKARTARCYHVFNNQELATVFKVLAAFDPFRRAVLLGCFANDN